MFENAIILYGSSFWETAATQICGHPKGMSLTSLLRRAARAVPRCISLRRRPNPMRVPRIECGRCIQV